MIQVGELDLLMGCPFPIPGIGTYRAPRLREHSQAAGVGLDKYNMLLSLLSMSSRDLIDAIGLTDRFSLLSEEQKQQFTPFLLITSAPAYRELLCEALDFFMSEKAVYHSDAGRFILCREDGSQAGILDDSNYDDLRLALMKANCLSFDNLLPPKKFRDKKAKRVFEKIQAAKRDRRSTVSDDSLSLCNVVSAVSARHNSYNLLNIWDLTVYQLYDQFSRIHLNHQIDVSALRWAAWGKEAFDFKLWYKNEGGTK